VHCVNIGLTVDPTIDTSVEITGQPVTEHRLVMLVGGCHTVRQSVCSAHASNGGSVFACRYQENGATPCQHIDTTRKAIDCTTTLPLTFF